MRYLFNNELDGSPNKSAKKKLKLLTDILDQAVATGART